MEAIDRSTLSPFQSMGWRMGSVFVRTYDRKDTAVFGTNFLHYLYEQTALSGSHVLQSAFCGMRDLTSDAICAYLHTRSPLLLMCMDDENESMPFHILGYSYPTVHFGVKGETERSMLLGYCYLRQAWGTPEATVAGMLAAAYMFLTYDLVAIHGQSYTWNQLTHRFAAQYGAHETGLLPRTLPKSGSDGSLSDCTWSTVLREDFEKYASEQLQTINENAL